LGTVGADDFGDVADGRSLGLDLPALPYSPDLNPIEQAFAKLKTLRKIAVRTVSALWDALGDILARFTPQECAELSRQRRICSTQAEFALASIFR
jgi:transposase